MESFGEYVKSTRLRLGWTIAYCADRAGIVWPRWKRIEEDKPKRSDGSLPQPRRETVEKIAKALGRPIEEALIVAGYMVDSHGSVSESKVSYEASEEEREELISAYEGVAPTFRPAALRSLKAFLESLPEAEPTTHGKRAE